jgi:acyl-CoA synthetase (AMP-forming)/AMP-acid ligase II
VVVAPVDRAAPPTLAALQDHCRAHLAGYKIPRVLHVVAGVERSPAGKADYQWARSVIAPVIAPVIPPVLGTETAP